MIFLVLIVVFNVVFIVFSRNVIFFEDGCGILGIGLGVFLLVSLR